ncbi:MAG TPA: glutamyl-tRNA reductase, partial [Deltaproteobacteria bacterium]|nr:glutamyl-tRNA reductase [Deltaproteobacteria bacterium]
CELGGEAGRFEDLERELASSDVVITSTGAARPIITREMVQRAMGIRRNRPLIIVDIALPRDVDEGAKECYNCYLYDIDALQAIVDRHFAEREAEAARAMAIIEEEVATFERWLRSLSAQATIRDLYALADAIAVEQAREVSSKVDATVVEQALRTSLRRMLHRPVSFLKEHPDARHIEYVRRIFRLDEDHEDRHKG